MDRQGTRPSLLDVVIFDWDGTLADTGEYPTTPADWEPAAGVLAPDDPSELAVRLHLVDEQVRRRMADEQRAVRVEAIIEETARLLGLDPGPDTLQQAVATHLEGCARRVVVDPSALDTLTLLRQADYRTGLSANTTWPGPFCESLIARDGLHMQLDARVYASDLGTWRPAVAAYRAMLAVLDVYDPRRVVFVGDDVTDDLRVAASMGMRTILVTTGTDEPRNHRICAGNNDSAGVDAAVHSLAEIPGWVAAWS